jgi:hypothetical protein
MVNAPGPFPTQILASQPAVRADGTLEPWLGQLLQLLLSYLGSPGSASGTGGGSSGGGATITQQISDLTQAISATPTPGVDGSTQARIMALENAPKVPLPLPQNLQAPPHPQAFPVAAAPSNFLDQAFGSTWGNILFRGQYTWQVLAPGLQPNLVLRTGGQNANPFWGIARPSGPGGLGTRHGSVATEALLGDGRGNVLSDGTGS